MITRISLLATCLTFAVSLTVRGDANPYDAVKSARMFAIGGIGITGVTSDEEVALRKIRDAPDAQEKLRRLLNEGTAAGKMYALFALKQLDTPDYDALAKPFRNSNVPLQRIQGCIISTAKTTNVVQWIDQNAQQIKSGEKSP
jgi:hypothetical protein